MLFEHGGSASQATGCYVVHVNVNATVLQWCLSRARRSKSKPAANYLPQAARNETSGHRHLPGSSAPSIMTSNKEGTMLVLHSIATTVSETFHCHGVRMLRTSEQAVFGSDITRTPSPSPCPTVANFTVITVSCLGSGCSHGRCPGAGSRGAIGRTAPAPMCTSLPPAHPQHSLSK